MKTYVIIFFILFSLEGVCQVSFKEYFDATGFRSDAESCFYYKQGVANKKGFYQDTVKSFYCRGDLLKSVEVYDGKGNLNGIVMNYYSTGQLREKVRYREGVRFGNATSFYKNGRTQMSSVYPDPKNFHANTPHRYLVVNYLDSLGNFEVQNMKGFCNCVGFFNGVEIVEKGKIMNGLRDSLWVGYKNGQLLFQETYAQGDFLNGVAYYDGKKSEYAVMEEQPAFDGGMDGLTKFLSKNLKYPAEARRVGVDGKVYVQFVVANDGSISEVQIIKSVMSPVDQEAMRVVKLMPPWLPGKVRGLPVKMKFVLPIRFKLDV